MKKLNALTAAVEALANGEAERAVVGKHPTFGWVWRDWEDEGGQSELQEVVEVTQATDYDEYGNVI